MAMLRRLALALDSLEEKKPNSKVKKETKKSENSIEGSVNEKTQPEVEVKVKQEQE